MNKKTKELANRISFRLLATNKHPDYKWLCDEIEKSKPSITELIRTSWNLWLDGCREEREN
tara:strand:+ start:18 stop:200 length:183 start_codon:yes stop_codon:yes gene_type:complete